MIYRYHIKIARKKRWLGPRYRSAVYAGRWPPRPLGDQGYSENPEIGKQRTSRELRGLGDPIINACIDLAEIVTSVDLPYNSYVPFPTSTL